VKTKISLWCFAFANIATSPDRTEQSFSGAIFQRSTDEASVELCINRLSDATAKSELKADWETFESKLGELSRMA